MCIFFFMTEMCLLKIPKVVVGRTVFIFKIEMCLLKIPKVVVGRTVFFFHDRNFPVKDT
jgi:hypothetical protein